MDRSGRQLVSAAAPAEVFRDDHLLSKTLEPTWKIAVWGNLP
jgi:hypothetical protein